MWFDRLTMNGGGRIGAMGVSGCYVNGAARCAGIVGCCWVPAGDAGMWFDSGRQRTLARLTMNGNGLGLGGREAGGVRLGMCSVGRADVFSFGGNVSRFRANVSSFWADVFSFEGNVSTLAGDVSSFRRCALVGDGARTQGEIPRLRCAALGTTTAAGANRGRGWRMLAMMSLPATQSLHALLAVQVRPG